MKREYVLVALFFALTAALVYLFYRIIIPFFVPICWAGVLAILFYPLYAKLQSRMKRKAPASLIVCFVIIVGIIAPVAYLFVALVGEAVEAVGRVNEMYKEGKLEQLFALDVPFINTLKEKLNEYFDISSINLDEIVRDAIEKVSGVVVSQTTWLVANATKAIFFFALTMFALFYFFKDGDRIVGRIKRLIPLPADTVSKTFTQLHEVILATMYGGLVVALVQGTLGGVLFAIVGISSPVFWGAIMAFLSIIPIVGAFLVYIPAGVILILGGSYVKGIIVILIGTIVISQIDNVIRPYFISGRTAMHPLLLFFAIMGGIALFGLLGLILGPIIAALFTTLLKIFELILHPEEETAVQGEVDAS
jgi:predicted PurR-regulated permease PerM